MTQARVGAHKVRAGTHPRHIAEQLQVRQTRRDLTLDHQPIADATLDDLNPELWERFRTSRTRDRSEERLNRQG